MLKNQDSSATFSILEKITLVPVRIAAALIVPFITLLILYYGFMFLRASEANKLVIVVVALLVGIGGVWALYYSTNFFIETMLNDRWKMLVRPFLFVGPALAVLFFYLIFPVIRSAYLSFFDRTSDNYVGFANYIFAFTDPAMSQAAINSILWMVVVTSLSVGFGLLIAILVENIRYEKLVKSLIFMPMAISFVGASVIWRFIYAFVPAGREQIGLLNALNVQLGFDPIGWLINQPWNNFMLMVVLIWLQTGFAMVLLSSAIKGVPNEIIESAQIDGANDVQVFFKIIVPTIRPTILTVSTTILILTLKVFDIVWVMTNGNYGTEVVASRMIKEIARFRDFGRASTIAVILLLATIPIMVYNVKRFRETEELR